MSILITKHQTKKEIKELLGKIKPSKKGSDVRKFVGKLKWKGNALKTQRSMRNED